MKKNTLLKIVSVLCSAGILLGIIPIWNLSADSEKTVTEPQDIYNAVSAVAAEEAKPSKSKFDNPVWSYEEKTAQKDEASGEFLPTGDWKKVNIWKSGWCDRNEKVRKAIPNMLYVWDGVGDNGRGLATYNGRVTIFVGNKCPVVPSLTFTAPYGGTVKLYDANEGRVGAASTDDPFSTLNQEGKKVGFAVYLNNEKIWPADSDYYTLTYTENSIEFPTLDNINISSGDKIRMAFIPLTQSWGYMALAPQIDYTDKLPAFSSAEEIKAAAENGSIAETSNWTYTAKHIAKDSETEKYFPTGDWFKPELSIAKSDSNAVNSSFNNRQLLIAGSNSGLAEKNGKVITYVGSSFNGVAGALTFVAPYSGTVNLKDPTGIGVGGAGKADPFWTLHNGAKEVGFAIYKNNEKLWPAEEDYYTFIGDNWQGKVCTEGNTQTSMPDISNLRVEKGDQIRFALIPLKNGWGYFELAPQIEYKSKDAVQPDDKILPSYSALNDIEKGLENGSLNNSNWILEGMACYPDIDGVNTPDGKWVSINPIPGKMSDSAVNAKCPNWLVRAGSKTGATVLNDAVILSTGSMGADYATVLTFVAPKSGKVKLSSPTGVKIGTAGLTAPFWTLNENTKIAGIAIYKNDEKLWPADSDYYKLQGKWDVETKKNIPENENETTFPTLENIEINAGDRLRISVIPVKNTWLYVKAAPQVDYMDIDENSSVPKPEVKPQKESYDAAVEVKKAMESGDLSKSLWGLQAIKYKQTEIVGGNGEIGALYNEKMPLMFKPMTFGNDLFPYKWFNIANTSIALTVTDTDRLMIPAGKTTMDGYRVWPAITFKAPKTGILRLYARGDNAGIAAAEKGGPYYTLQDTLDPDDGGSIKTAIYKNNNQIWPRSKSDDNVLTVKKRVVPFPDMQLQVYEGDIIRIIIPDDGWKFVTMSPIAEYVSYNSLARPKDDSPVWAYGKEENTVIEWDDLDFSYDDTAEIEPEQTEETEDKKTLVKKVIKKKRYQVNADNGISVWIIVIICIGAVGILVGGFFIARKIIKNKKQI